MGYITAVILALLVNLLYHINATELDDGIKYNSGRLSSTFRLTSQQSMALLLSLFYIGTFSSGTEGESIFIARK